MAKVLAISRYFPPIGSAGSSIRLTKFMKVAIQNQWSFWVMTQNPDRPVIPEKQTSGFLLDELPSDLPIIRISNPFFNSKGLIQVIGKLFGTSSLPWGCVCVFFGIKFLRTHEIDLIFVNTPPFTNVFIGILLSILFNIPLVVDFKDDWVGSHAFMKKGRIRRALESSIEKFVIHHAKEVIVVTTASYQTYTQRYPNENKFSLIPNGIDLDEYKILRNQQRKIETEKFTLLTAASGYRSNYRDLGPLLTAIHAFFKRVPEAIDFIEIIFLGDSPGNEYQDEIHRLGLDRLIHYQKASSRDALINWLWFSDLFFLIQPRENYTSISGTLYEYWATGKAPVLLISETGASSELVKMNHFGEHFRFNQINEISEYIEKIYSAYHLKRPIWIDNIGVEDYDRNMLSLKLILSLNQVLALSGKK